MHDLSCQNLDAYLDGGLSESDQKEFDLHLLTCPHCQREVHLQQRVDSLLANAAQLEPIPRELVDRVQQRIHSTSQRRRFATIGLTVAATIVMAIGVWSRWQGNPEPKRVPIVENRQTDGSESDKSNLPRKPPKPAVVAEVSVGPASDGIIVPLKSNDSKVAIFWIYPTGANNENQ
jgi:anti-sigma factor (TIGR02949 family)